MISTRESMVFRLEGCVFGKEMVGRIVVFAAAAKLLKMQKNSGKIVQKDSTCSLSCLGKRMS